MKDKEVVIVYSDDWEGIYIDGKLKFQNHTIEYNDMLRALGIEHTSQELDYEWLQSRGTLPDDLGDVQFE